MRIVITGGIGSGKSAVKHLLAEEFPTFEIVSIDDIVRSLYESQDVITKLTERFGTADKIVLSQLVFDNPDRRIEIESFFSPYITRTLIDKLSSYPNIIMEFPLLFEKGENMIDLFDTVITVVSDQQSRIFRVCERDSATVDKVVKIMDVQTTDEERFRRSNVIIQNNGTKEDLACTVAKTANRLRLKNMKGKIGVVSGSFDPITMGHLWIIKKALNVVDHVVVAIAQNSAKKHMFSSDEREEMIRGTLAENLPKELRDRVIIGHLPANELLVGYAKSIGANFIVRGIRNVTDFEYEHQIDLVQSKIAPDMLTIYLIPDRRLTEISSSLIKGVLGLREWEKIAEGYVSHCVIEKLRGVARTDK